MLFTCNKCGSEYEIVENVGGRTSVEPQSGKRYIKCPKDGAYAYQKDWSSDAKEDESSSQISELEEKVDALSTRIEELEEENLRLLEEIESGVDAGEDE